MVCAGSSRRQKKRFSRILYHCMYSTHCQSLPLYLGVNTCHGMWHSLSMMGMSGRILYNFYQISMSTLWLCAMLWRR